MSRATASILVPLLVGLAFAVWLTQAPLTESTAQHAGAKKITGKVSDKLIRHFEPAGLPGVRSVEYRRLTMSPGATMEGNMVMEDHVELCIVEEGSVTITLANGSTHTYKEGDVFVKPKGYKQARLVADPQQGFVELYWLIKLKGRH